MLELDIFKKQEDKTTPLGPDYTILLQQFYMAVHLHYLIPEAGNPAYYSPYKFYNQIEAQEQWCGFA